MFNYTFRIYKDGKFEVHNGPKGGKLSILACDLENKILVLKQNAYAAYVDRVIRTQYNKPCIFICDILQINVYKEFVHIDCKVRDEYTCIKPLKLVQYLYITQQVKEYDPLSIYSPEERKQLEEVQKTNNEIMKEFQDVIDKHKGNE